MRDIRRIHLQRPSGHGVMYVADVIIMIMIKTRQNLAERMRPRVIRYFCVSTVATICRICARTCFGWVCPKLRLLRERWPDII